MKKKITGLLLGSLVGFTTLVFATPSTSFWAPSTPYLQPFGVMHVTYDTYFRDNASYPVDTGLTIGVLPFEKLQMEVGFDLLQPGNYPVSFNGKIGSPENALFKGSPGWSFGAFNVGTKKDVTDTNVLYFMLGKTFPVIGEPEIGFYNGLNKNLMLSSDGGEQRSGLMAGWFSPDIKAPYINKMVLTADIMTGSNALGAWGGGIYFYFTPQISLLTGPVWFFDREMQPGKADFLWTMQLDIDFDVKPAKK